MSYTKPMYVPEELHDAKWLAQTLRIRLRPRRAKNRVYMYHNTEAVALILRVGMGRMGRIIRLIRWVATGPA